MLYSSSQTQNIGYMSGDPEEPIFMQGRVTLARTFTHTIINPLQLAGAGHATLTAACSRVSQHCSTAH